MCLGCKMSSPRCAKSLSSFNEAEAYAPRMLLVREELFRAHRRFNEAEAYAPRMRDDAGADPIALAVLQ